jgi:hypothetical protein
MTKLADETLITPTLLHRFELEAGEQQGQGGYYALIRRSNGDLVSHHPFAPGAEPHQLMWAAEVLGLLNRDLHHNGAWVVVFTHPKRPSLETVLHQPRHAEYARYALIWIDADGDPQFSQEWSENESEMRDFADVMLAGIHSTAQKCEASWQAWKLMMLDVIGPREGQTYKKAKGQRPASMRQ